MGDGSGVRRVDLFALAATLATIGLHVALKLTTGKLSVPFIAGAVAFWAVFVVIRRWQDKDVFERWGFRRANLGSAAAASAIVFCVGALAMAAYAGYRGDLEFPAHTLILFLVYPAWGIIQQFLALAIVVGNLDRLDPTHRARPATALASAALFAAIHFYDWRLAAATFFLELAAIPIYLRYRNLWPLGILQGWLGALFYLWVLGEDLWGETMRQLERLMP